MQGPGYRKIAVTGGVVLVLGAVVAGVIALRSGPAGRPANGGGNTSSNHTETNRAKRLPVYATLPTFRLTEQGGNPFGSRELQGKVWIGNFMFTRCAATCPRQTSELGSLQEELQSHPFSQQIHFVSISVDPEFDSPQVLKAYASKAGADPERWKFLTGDKRVIRQLSEKGFKLPIAEVNEDSAASPSHSSKFILVDRMGRIRGLYDHNSESALKQLLSDMDRVLAEIDLFAEGVIHPDWLETRRDDQLATLSRFEVFHDFGFEDRIAQSNITFRNKIVDDAGRNWKGVHYDHGNGVAIGDVDGDGLSDIYFTTQVGSNELWRNLGDGRFENVTEAAGVSVDDRISVAASFADVDNDGDPDLYVTTVREGNILFVNNGNGQFRDVTEDAGLVHKGHSSSAVFFDYDRDGLLDLFLVNVGRYTTDELAVVASDRTTAHEPGKYRYYVGMKDAFSGQLKPERAERSILYRNEGDLKFKDVSQAVGLIDVSWSGDASPCDINQDGWPDLYVLNMQGNDEYYENEQGERFVKRSREVFPKTPWGSMGIKFFDYNNDGKQDLYVTDMHSDMSQKVGPEKEKQKADMQWPESFLLTEGMSIFGNALYRNSGNGQFEEVSDDMWAENYWPWGLSTADLNADGYEDVFIASSMNHPFRYGVNSVLLNNRGKEFLDSEFILGVEPRRNGRTAIEWFEIDCSGADRDNQFCGTHQGRVTMWGALGSRSSVIFDLDGDGDLDIVTNDFNSSPMVLISNLAERMEALSFLKIKLIGSKSNRDGLGARVQVETDSDKFMKVHDGQSGYLSQSSTTLYFGLGSATRIERVHVQWPSGNTQTVAGPVDLNSELTVRED